MFTISDCTIKIFINIAEGNTSSKVTWQIELKIFWKKQQNEYFRILLKFNQFLAFTIDYSFSYQTTDNLSIFRVFYLNGFIFIYFWLELSNLLQILGFYKYSSFSTSSISFISSIFALFRVGGRSRKFDLPLDTKVGDSKLGLPDMFLEFTCAALNSGKTLTVNLLFRIICCFLSSNLAPIHCLNCLVIKYSLNDLLEPAYLAFKTKPCLAFSECYMLANIH